MNLSKPWWPKSKVETLEAKATKVETLEAKATKVETLEAKVEKLETNAAKAETLQAKVETMQADGAKMKHRLDGIATVFRPATKYAVYETAVYKYVEKFLPDRFEDKQRSLIQHGMVQMCGAVLRRLLL
jgi:outer membrane murein-binding lipoprotein Lpp